MFVITLHVRLHLWVIYCIGVHADCTYLPIQTSSWFRWLANVTIAACATCNETAKQSQTMQSAVVCMYGLDMRRVTGGLADVP